MRIYIDQEMCASLGVTYYGSSKEEIHTTPYQLVRLRGTHKGYDQAHTDFFAKVGQQTTLKLKNEGFGWWVVQ